MDRAKQIIELKQFFYNRELPKEVQLNQAEKITDLPKFLESHFAVLEEPGERNVNRVFLDRLYKVKEMLGKESLK